jgi:branched-subunit amino acid transport protein
MDIRAEILLIALGSAAVTLIPRAAPLVLLSRIALPDGLKAWLSYVPIAILGSLLSSELLLSGGRLAPLSGNLALVAIVPAIAIAWRYRSIIGSVLAGIAAMILLRALSG